ncbi:MAG: hypothetical protein ACM34I_02940 [bacterium]
MKTKLTLLIIFGVVLLFSAGAHAVVINETIFAELQPKSSHLSIGDRIAFWAGKFIGTPYDPDPLGEYVRKSVIVADERVDCMYHTFRSVELAQSTTYDESIARALDLRFRTEGVLDEQGKVTNYDDRFQYGEDMVLSGKWGKNVTSSLGKTMTIPGARDIESIRILPKKGAVRSVKKLRSGDIIFFVKDPAKRKVDEIVGHIGIVSRTKGGVYLIHASGNKNNNGEVKKADLTGYLKTMPFVGMLVTRFDVF